MKKMFLLLCSVLLLLVGVCLISQHALIAQVVEPQCSATPPEPELTIDASPRSGAAPLAVQFSFDFSVPDFDEFAGCDDFDEFERFSSKITPLDDDDSESSENVFWEFGDGGSSTKESPEHIYFKPGFYTVSLDYLESGVSLSRSNFIEVIEGVDIIGGAITVGNSPHGIAVNEKTNGVYVANKDDDTVSVIDWTSNEVVETIEVGDAPESIDVNTVTNTIYVANKIDNTMSVINGADNAVVDIISLDKIGKLHVDSGKNMVFVNTGFKTDIIDGATNKVSDSISHNFNEIDADNNLMFSIETLTVIGDNFEEGTFFIELFTEIKIIDIETGQVIDSTSEDKSFAINIDGEVDIETGINRSTNHLYISFDYSHGSADDFILDIDYNNPDSLVKNSINFWDPGVVVINESLNRIYVANNSDNTVKVIDGVNTSIIGTINAESKPNGLAVNSKTGLIYLVNSKSNTVTVVEDVKCFDIEICDNEIDDNCNGLTDCEDLEFCDLDISEHCLRKELDKNCFKAVEADFTSDTTTGNAPLTVKFNDKSNPGSFVLNTWRWDFGDGETGTDQNPAHTYNLIGIFSVTLQTSAPEFFDVGAFTLCSTNDLFDSVTKNDFITVIEPAIKVDILTVEPASIKSSILPQNVTITAKDLFGKPLPDALITASTKGAKAVVKPKSTTTDQNGIAKFKARFGFRTNDGEILFITGNGTVTVTQKPLR